MSYKKKISAAVAYALQTVGAHSAWIAPNALTSEPPASEPKPDRARSLDWRVRRILLFIDSENGKTGQDMAEICRILDLGISADYAMKLFKKETGIGFREY